VLRRQLDVREPLRDDERVHVIDVDTAAAVDVAAICARWRRSDSGVSSVRVDPVPSA
jgi:hypothetical protein